jgi:hypothetical protein
MEPNLKAVEPHRFIKRAMEDVDSWWKEKTASDAREMTSRIEELQIVPCQRSRKW